MDIDDSIDGNSTKKKPMVNVKIRLRNAFFEILESKDFDKISVSEICSKAELSRQTFYTIYATKEDIVRSYYLSFLAKLHKEMEHFQGDIHARSLKLMEVLLNDKCLLMLYKYTSLQGLLQNSLKEHLDIIANKYHVALTQERQILHIIASSLCSSLVFNIANGFIDMSNDKIVNLYRELLSDSMFMKLVNYG